MSVSDDWQKIRDASVSAWKVLGARPIGARLTVEWGPDVAPQPGVIVLDGTGATRSDRQKLILLANQIRGILLGYPFTVTIPSVRFSWVFALPASPTEPAPGPYDPIIDPKIPPTTPPSDGDKEYIV